VNKLIIILGILVPQVFCNAFAGEDDYRRGYEEQPKPLLLNDKDKYLLAIDQASLVGAPNSIKDCANSKFSYKDVCLGVSLAEFTKFKKLSLIEPTKLLKNQDVYSARRRNVSGDIYGDCQYRNISFMEGHRNPYSYKTPLGFTDIICSEGNTFLGLTVDVNYVFINERLSSININSNGGDNNRVNSINFIAEPLIQKMQEPNEKKLVVGNEGVDWNKFFMRWSDDTSKSSFSIDWRTFNDKYQGEVGSWTILINKPEVMRLYNEAVKQSRIDTDNFINSKSKNDF
jgi:hypothetical protein